MGEVNLCLLDLDNTLTYTKMSYFIPMAKRAVESLGGTFKEEVVYEIFGGLPDAKLISEVWGVNYDKFWSEFNKGEDIDERLRQADVYPEVYTFFEIANQIGGLEFDLITSSPPYVRDRVLERFRIRKNFRYVVSTGINGIREKPDTQAIRYIFEKRGSLYTPANAVLCGDHEKDIQMAQRAGVMAVWLNRKERRFGQLHPPDKEIKSLIELLPYLQ